MKGQKIQEKYCKKRVYNNFEMVSSDKYKCNFILFALWKQISHACSQILEFIFIYLNKNWKIYWFEQSFTGLGPDDWCSSQRLLEDLKKSSKDILVTLTSYFKYCLVTHLFCSDMIYLKALCTLCIISFF
jgi:hypothetical protein